MVLTMIPRTFLLPFCSDSNLEVCLGTSGFLPSQEWWSEGWLLMEGNIGNDNDNDNGKGYLLVKQVGFIFL